MLRGKCFGLDETRSCCEKKIEKSHDIIFSVTNVGGIMETRGALLSLAFLLSSPVKSPNLLLGQSEK